MKLNRNNTNFPLELFEKLRHLEPDYPFLRYYQNLIRLYLTKFDVDSKGLLLYIGMGMGKTITASALALEMMSEYQPIVLLSKSLVGNMKTGISQYINMRKDYDDNYKSTFKSEEDVQSFIDANFRFVSMNASNMLDQLRRATLSQVELENEKLYDKKIAKLGSMNLDGKLLIVDEAHNLFRAIVNGSKNAVGLYNKIKSSKNVKLVFLTGTPIVNDPYELVPCFNMLSPGLFPEDYEKFYDSFFSETGFINRDKFQDRIFGLVSHVNVYSKQGHNSAYASEVKLPVMADKYDNIVMKLKMDPYQQQLYKIAKEKELRERSYGKSEAKYNVSKDRSSSTSTYKIKTRQISNFAVKCETLDPIYMPDSCIDSPKMRAIRSILIKHDGQKGIIYSQFVQMTGLFGIGRYLKKLGWKQLVVSGTELSEGENISIADETEADILVDKIGGDEVPSRSLDLDISGTSYKFAVISGSIKQSDRDIIMDYYNRSDNMHGEKLMLLLISSTGAEGLNLLAGRFGIVLEPYWSRNRIEQVEKRIIRDQSHTMLPLEEQNVQFYELLCIDEDGDESTDEEMYRRGFEKDAMIKPVLRAIESVSIECMLNGEENCRTCQPNDSVLYTDFDRDMNKNSNCIVDFVKKVMAEEFEHDGKKYTFTSDPFHIYSFDSAVGKWRKIPENSDLYVTLTQVIKGI